MLTKSQSFSELPSASNQGQIVNVAKSTFFDLLAVKPGASRKEVDHAYALIVQNFGELNISEEIRIAWKVLRDPYYSKLYAKTANLESLIEAGWFDDGANLLETLKVKDATNFLMTPIHKIRDNIKKLSMREGKLAVLITTGAFSPPHPGHIEMMEKAKLALESKGVHVVGGYLSPSHDQYIREKIQGGDYCEAAFRLSLCEEFIENSDWLMTDGWEALLNSRSINFTDVIERLKSYLSRHIKTDIPFEVYYVFGSDNAGFINAFTSKGAAICVERDDIDVSDDIITILRESDRDNLLFVEADSNAQHSSMSSTKVRKGISLSYPKKIMEKWKRWKRSGFSPIKAGLTSEIEMRLREEGSWLLEPWVKERDLSKLQSSLDIFNLSLRNAFKEALRSPTDSREGYSKVSVVPVLLSQQLKEVKERFKGRKLISLDTCIEGDQNIEVSRLFDLCESKKDRGLVSRVGQLSIEEQVRRIPDGEYILIDDDIATGKTIRYVKERLPEGVNILATEALSDIIYQDQVITSNDRDKIVQVSDVCDSRDFLPGSRQGGLVLELPDGEHTRVPYTLPYVQLRYRAKFPISSELNFSRKVWAMSLEFYQSVSPAIQVSETSEGFQKLASYIGFKLETPMSEVCKWHLEYLNAWC